MLTLDQGAQLPLAPTEVPRYVQREAWRTQNIRPGERYWGNTKPPGLVAWYKVDRQTLQFRNVLEGAPAAYTPFVYQNAPTNIFDAATAHAVYGSDVGLQMNGTNQHLVGPAFPFTADDNWTLELIFRFDGAVGDPEAVGGTFTIFSTTQDVSGQFRGIQLSLNPVLDIGGGQRGITATAYVGQNFGVADVFINSLPLGPTFRDAPIHMVLSWTGRDPRSGAILPWGSKSLLFSVNGVTDTVRRSPSGTGTTISTANPMNIGRGVGGNNQFFPGAISELCIYNRRLLAAEHGLLYERFSTPRNPIILSSDNNSDVGDLYAIAMAASLSLEQQIDLRAVLIDSASPWAAAGARAVLDWYGLRGTIVGTTKTADGTAGALGRADGQRDLYNLSTTGPVTGQGLLDVANAISLSGRTDWTTPAASGRDAARWPTLGVAARRAIGSCLVPVSFLCLGFATGVNALRTSAAQGGTASLLPPVLNQAGAALMTARVSRVVVVAGFMGGSKRLGGWIFEPSAAPGGNFLFDEYNASVDREGWQAFFNAMTNVCPVDVVGIELGQWVETSLPLIGTATTNPLLRARQVGYINVPRPGDTTPVWDQQALVPVLFPDLYDRSLPGRVRVTNDGEMSFDRSSPGFGHRYLIERTGQEAQFLRDFFNEIVQRQWRRA